MPLNCVQTYIYLLISKHSFKFYILDSREILNPFKASFQISSKSDNYKLKVNALKT
jgi:hypothetical protein